MRKSSPLGFRAKGGGGVVVPAWVQALAAPSGALPHVALDFKNTRYWNGTSESVDPLSCLVENTGFGAFDPATITPGSGMSCFIPPNNCAPVLIDALAAPLIATGITTVLTCNVVDDGITPTEVAFDIEMDQLPDFNTQYNSEVFVKLNGFEGTVPVLAVFNQSDGIVENAAAVTTGGSHKLASTLTLARCDWAIDGAAKTGITPTVIPSSPITNICFQTNTQGVDVPKSFLELAVIYAPQPVGDLIALSTP